eukprot:CAMPEP_0194378698 /NCGR_PEP_ID=MMETSP0174-20130528/36987_1 /TAXON_ID=216777 /ORGANISM="Proboscia alata, Strain PI-D3" /LENGTH=457 /DNA_ID=CAMNT_0039160929 /DNA_START=142 /DNA_END=1515 /DNA_ORIENTATION=+
MTYVASNIPANLEDSSNSSGENPADSENGVPLEIIPPRASSNSAFVESFYTDDTSDDMNSGDIDRHYTGVFEGPEKTLEVCFRRIGSLIHHGAMRASDSPESRVGGLRKIARTDLDRVCARARCTILSSISNQYLDAYVLSESSLFVYPYMAVLKTCGTTTLLRCIAILIELARTVGLEIDWVGYSRKNFSFPGDQAFPHESFHQELEYLSSHHNLSERLQGNGYTLGPVTSDHWFVFVADQTNRANSQTDTDRVLNIMMFDIDQTVASHFYYDQYEGQMEGESEDEAVSRISKTMTRRAGIDSLCPGAVIDPRAFEPCGYSMNAILFQSYSTMHITPEDGSSYASFETNQRVSSYNSLINNVIRMFNPKRFVMTLMADELGLEQMDSTPFDRQESKIIIPYATSQGKGGSMCYKRSQIASIQVEDDCCCMMGNWVVNEDDFSKRARSSKSRSMTIS